METALTLTNMSYIYRNLVVNAPSGTGDYSEKVDALKNVTVGELKEGREGADQVPLDQVTNSKDCAVEEELHQKWSLEEACQVEDHAVFRCPEELSRGSVNIETTNFTSLPVTVALPAHNANLKFQIPSVSSDQV